MKKNSFAYQFYTAVYLVISSPDMAKEGIQNNQEQQIKGQENDNKQQNNNEKQLNNKEEIDNNEKE